METGIILSNLCIICNIIGVAIFIYLFFNGEYWMNRNFKYFNAFRNIGFWFLIVGIIMGCVGKVLYGSLY